MYVFAALIGFLSYGELDSTTMEGQEVARWTATSPHFVVTQEPAVAEQIVRQKRQKFVSKTFPRGKEVVAPLPAADISYQKIRVYEVRWASDGSKIASEIPIEWPKGFDEWNIPSSVEIRMISYADGFKPSDGAVYFQFLDYASNYLVWGIRTDPFNDETRNNPSTYSKKAVIALGRIVDGACHVAPYIDPVQNPPHVNFGEVAEVFSIPSGPTSAFGVCFRMIGQERSYWCLVLRESGKGLRAWGASNLSDEQVLDRRLIAFETGDTNKIRAIAYMGIPMGNTPEERLRLYPKVIRVWFHTTPRGTLALKDLRDTLENNGIRTFEGYPRIPIAEIRPELEALLEELTQPKKRTVARK